MVLLETAIRNALHALPLSLVSVAANRLQALQVALFCSNLLQI